MVSSLLVWVFICLNSLMVVSELLCNDVVVVVMVSGRVFFVVEIVFCVGVVFDGLVSRVMWLFLRGLVE